MTNTEKSMSVELRNELQYYKTHTGYNSFGEDQVSGAYVFRPASNVSEHVALNVTTTVVKVILNMTLLHVYY